MYKILITTTYYLETSNLRTDVVSFDYEQDARKAVERVNERRRAPHNETKCASYHQDAITLF